MITGQERPDTGVCAEIVRRAGAGCLGSSLAVGNEGRTSVPDPGDSPSRRIAEYFRAQILSGDLRQGERLPSTREIAADWQVAAKTAERAIALLRDEGIVRTRPGRGGTVVDRALPVSVAAPTLGDRTVISVAEVTGAPEGVARELAIRPGADVVRRRGILYRGETAVGTITSWWPASLAGRIPALLALDQLGVPTSLFVHVEQATGRCATYGRDHLGASSSTSEEAGLLGIPTGHPVLHHQTWVYDQDDHVIEYAEKVSAVAVYEYSFGDPQRLITQA
ncbi:MAG TPA: GntR family transcriptional regulator [Kineosporiaceae bacterium]|nr:GntR family transcriptional regulator [Kineosporiaceae bacterium]